MGAGAGAEEARAGTAAEAKTEAEAAGAESSSDARAMPRLLTPPLVLLRLAAPLLHRPPLWALRGGLLRGPGRHWRAGRGGRHRPLRPGRGWRRLDIHCRPHPPHCHRGQAVRCDEWGVCGWAWHGSLWMLRPPVLPPLSSFAAYGYGGRDGSMPADISEYTLYDVYLRPWCVENTTNRCAQPLLMRLVFASFLFFPPLASRPSLSDVLSPSPTPPPGATTHRRAAAASWRPTTPSTACRATATTSC